MAHEHTLDGPSTPGETGHDAADDQAGSVPEAGDQADVVELSVPALNAYLGVVRTATAGLAARLSFSLDEIEDLRIAVDEACVMLLSLPAPPPPETATLTCRFRVLDEGLSVRVSAPVGRQAILPGEQSFAWQVLTAHAAAVRGHADGGHAEIDLLKRRRRR